jgi:hypothetical protein
MKITLTELRQLVKSIIKEQLTNQPAGNAVDNLRNSNYGGASFKGRTVQFYSDQANTVSLFTVKIDEVYPPHQGNNYAAVEIQTNKGLNYPIMFDCKKGVATYRGPETQNKVVNIYSNKFLSEVKALCKR